MAHFENSRYYESEKQLPKISQADFAVEGKTDIDEDTHDLINYLITLEPLYKEHILINEGKPDARVCNEIFFACLRLFEKYNNIVIIYSEIVDFFQFDNAYFYKCLTGNFKRKLKEALEQRVSLDTYERLKQRAEAQEGGAFTPSFANLMKRLKKT